MSQFLTHLKVSLVTVWVNQKKIRLCRLQKPLHYKSDLLGKVIVVPTGFESDGASVPQFLWGIYPPFGKYLEAAVVHDWYCVLGHKDESPIDSVMAAKVFREAMAVCGVPMWRRNKMYWAVRMGGPRFDAFKL